MFAGPGIGADSIRGGGDGGNRPIVMSIFELVK